MSPTEEALELADYLIANNPNTITTDRYTLAYSIDAWCDRIEAMSK